MNFLETLKERWQLGSLFQVLIVLIVFALTGFTVMFLKTPVLDLIQVNPDYSFYFSIIYYLLILPVYNLILLFYGALFGQFNFFWNFEKRMWNRLSGRKEDENTE
ncbi:MAG: hypothetical protein JXR07_06125 [Reichenbachiella sp.]